MVAAIVVTFTEAGFGNHFLLFGLTAIPAVGLGLYIAQSVNMTEMPQLVALFHSFVGLAAVMVGHSRQVWFQAKYNLSLPGRTGKLPLSSWCGACLVSLAPVGGVRWSVRGRAHLHRIW